MTTGRPEKKEEQDHLEDDEQTVVINVRDDHFKESSTPVFVAVDEKKVEHMTVPKSVRLPKHRSFDEFTFTESMTEDTAHTVHEVFDQKKERYFLKINPPNAMISFLEAAISDFYRVLAPSYVTPSAAVFRENDCIGVASKAIPHFVPHAKDKLKESDLDFSFMQARQLSIDTMDQLENEFKQLDSRDIEIERKLIIVGEDRKIFKTLSQQFKENIDAEKNEEFKKQLTQLAAKYAPTVADSNEAELLIQINIHLTKQQLKLESASIAIARDQRLFRDKMAREHNGLSLEELDRYRIVKGLGICLAISYIFKEADLHHFNFGKYGDRLDFDWSKVKEIFAHKLRGLVAKFFNFRAPDERTVITTSHDLDNFPDLIDRILPFWPTQEPLKVVISKSITAVVVNTASAVKSGLNMRDNNYTPEDNALFKRLKKIDVFRHHAFSMFAKYIMTHRDIYKFILVSHVAPGVQQSYNGQMKDVIDVFSDSEKENIDDFLEKLLGVSEFPFPEFFKENYKKIANELRKDLTQQGIIESKPATEEKTSDTPTDAIEERCKVILESLSQTQTHQRTKTRQLSVTPPMAASLLTSEPEETKQSELLANLKTYHEMDEAVRKAMLIYTNPTQQGVVAGIVSMFGYGRTHGDVASRMTKKCDELKPDENSADAKAYLLATKQLYDAVMKEFEPFKNIPEKDAKEMHKTLLNLKDIFAKALPAEALAPPLSLPPTAPTLQLSMTSADSDT